MVKVDLPWLAAIVSVGAFAPALAEVLENDKSGYHLFNPTPPDQMRPLSTDRPDGTESPITVDAGHAQLELSFVDYVHDDEATEDLDAWTVFDTNIKVGVLNNVDTQFVFGAYAEEETNPHGAPSETLNGFTDVQIRVKVNLWGNDPVRPAAGD